MTYFLSRRLLFAVAGISLTFLPPNVHENARGQSVDNQDGAGIVWFIGAVAHRSDGQPTIDMGDAHGLTEGTEVAVFRSKDNHFLPLGIIQIEESFATWSIPAKNRTIELQTGDRIIYVRTLSQIGTGDSFRDAFLRKQLIKTGERNSYGTALEQSEAATLQRYIARHPKWVRDHKHITGTIRSQSVSAYDVEDMQPLLNQVMKFQYYQKLGVPLKKAIGAEWSRSLEVLTAAPEFVFGQKANSDEISSNATPSSDASETTNLQPEGDAETKRIEAFRRHVNKLLFVRAAEERNVVMAICVTIEKVQPKNERQWFSLQIKGTQFPSLAEDVQFLNDLQTIMRRVREEL